MTYQVLARKWRPKNFAQLIGQLPVSQALIYALTENRLHHAYLFTGTRGVGKTTIARILAKCLNCEQGVSAIPCGVCSTCVEIDTGSCPDFLEVDAASRTRIEDTKELLDNVVYAPLRGRFKIYLIDEVHMLSGHSFNALLKTLEEPPAHVKFIFATTEPHRIPVTVLSRCLHFNLRPLTQIDLENQLTAILQAEKIPFEARAVHLLAKAGKGSSRDALSLLEQAIGVGQGELKADYVAHMLGLRDEGLVYPLMQALCHQDLPQLFKLTSQLVKGGADFERILELILENLHALSMMQMVPEAKVHIHHLKEVDEAILALHTQLTAEQTQLYYQIALLGKRDLSIMPDLGRAFEMVLLRMICFQLTPQKRPTQPVTAPVKPLTPPPQDIKPTAFKPIQAASSPKPVIENEPCVQDTPNWRALISKLPLGGIVKLLAQHCVIQKWTPPYIVLTLEASQQPFLNADREKELSQALTTYFKCPMQVSILLQGTSSSPGEAHLSPARQVQTEQKDKESQAQAILAKEDMVKTLIDVFDAKLMKVTLKEEP